MLNEGQTEAAQMANETCLAISQLWKALLYCDRMAARQRDSEKRRAYHDAMRILRSLQEKLHDPHYDKAKETRRSDNEQYQILRQVARKPRLLKDFPGAFTQKSQFATFRAAGTGSQAKQIAPHTALPTTANSQGHCKDPKSPSTPTSSPTSTFSVKYRRGLN
jgi:hypothetical protein